MVNLSSNDTGEATVPATVTITGTNASATFDVTGQNDTLLDGTQTVTLTASAGDREKRLFLLANNHGS